METLVTNPATSTTSPPPTKPAPPDKAPAAAKTKFGLLKRVDLDAIWNDTDCKFGDWLTENVSMLDSTLDMSFTNIEKVGKSDFVASDTNRKQTVLIETQLQQTSNHNLGRILVHAVQHAADVIVWVVAEVREEHKAAARWLNSNGRFDFYLVELHAYSVGDTMAANFEVA